MHEVNHEDINLENSSPHIRYMSIVSALGLHNKTLFIGSSTISGDLWVGGLVIYKLKNSPEDNLGRIEFEDELAVVDDISQQVVTEITFDSSVASIAPLNLNGNELTDAVIVGLNDGSIQLVTLREMSLHPNSHQSQMQPVTINSATYHDWPLEKVMAFQISGSTNSHIITLDTAGYVKLWDCQSLIPIKSWSINTTTWPVNGSALSPDISLFHSNNHNASIINNNNNNNNNSEPFLLSTINPLDYKRKICLWDIRIHDVCNPIVIQYSDCSSILHNNNDLPTALNWFSKNQLLVGTYEGHLLVYDIRNPKMELSDVNIKNSCNTSKSSSSKFKQVVQILTDDSESTIRGVEHTQHIGLLQINGSIDVYQYSLSSDNNIFTHIYHHSNNYEGQTITHKNGRFKPCGLFLSSNFIHSQSWKLLLSSGIVSSSSSSSSSTPTSMDYQLRLHPNFNSIKAPGLNHSTRIHYIKSMNAKQPYIEASELNANDVQVTLIMQGLQAPNRGLYGCIKPSCKGNFNSDSFSTTCASIRKQLGNGLLKVELGEYTLNVLCELTNPNCTYEYHVRQFPSKIMPTFCKYQIKHNKLKLQLRKASGSDQWSGALAVKGLDQG
ncbi:hypothetical protein MN116_008218 [Schistosoma mekongi]|uniref:Uncharacterized protein n=1 Tax=Schistosoma mekongi TaxID=38744 RepID=A0AAE2D1T0_SCHME|nr:hypothetical protein MN116_008218 [Schistosoma mekongi]